MKHYQHAFRFTALLSLLAAHVCSAHAAESSYARIDATSVGADDERWCHCETECEPRGDAAGEFFAQATGRLIIVGYCRAISHSLGDCVPSGELECEEIDPLPPRQRSGISASNLNGGQAAGSL